MEKITWLFFTICSPFLSLQVKGEKWLDLKPVLNNNEVEVQIQFKPSSKACDSFGKPMKFRFNVVRKSFKSHVNLICEIKYLDCYKKSTKSITYLEVGQLGTLGLIESIDFTIPSNDKNPEIISATLDQSMVSVPNSTQNPNPASSQGNSKTPPSVAAGGKLCLVNMPSILSKMPTCAFNKDTTNMVISELNRSLSLRTSEVSAIVLLNVLSAVSSSTSLSKAGNPNNSSLDPNIGRETDFLRKVKKTFKKVRKDNSCDSTSVSTQIKYNQILLNEGIFLISNEENCARVEDLNNFRNSPTAEDISKKVRIMLGVDY